MPPPGIMSADPVPTFGPRMVCTRCGVIGVDAQPNASLLQCNTPLPRWATSGNRGPFQEQPNWCSFGCHPQCDLRSRR
jgi:hypothetical protein